MNTPASQVPRCVTRVASAWVVIGFVGAAGCIGFGATGCTAPPAQPARTGPAPVVTRKAPLMGLHFNISMPGIATREEIDEEEERKNKKQGKPPLDMTGYTSNVNGALFVAYEQDTTDQDLTEDKGMVEDILKGACDGFAKGGKGKETRRISIAKEDWPGKEVEGTMPTESGSDAIYKMRVFVDPEKGRTMYFGVFGPKKRLAEKDVDAFFASFSPPY